jgi:O-methyltransferase involved in polyketide biosynthesis
MYLQPESAHESMQTISDLSGPSSRVVFDYVHAAVLRQDLAAYGAEDIVETVAGADERWHFGIEEDKIEEFLTAHGLRLLDHKGTAALEAAYFTDEQGRRVGRVNGTHSLVTAETV